MQNQYGYGWNLLEKPIKFSINANTTSLSLTELPPKARKVKLFICFAINYCVPGNFATWNFSTKVGIIKISGVPYDQYAWNVQNVNCALRLDERKIIEVSRIDNFPNGAFSFDVEVLGYK